MDEVKLAVARLWRAANHLSTAQWILTLAGSFLGGGVVTAVIAAIAPVPAWVLGLIAVGAVLFVYGVIALWWEGRRFPTSSPEPSQVREWGIHGGAKRAPAPPDLSDFSLPAKALDRANKVALEKAKADLAPDAVVEFYEIVVLPSLSIRFRTWSRIANSNAHVMVNDDTATLWGRREGALWKRGDEESGAELPVWDYDSGPAPWKVEKDWQELVRQAWYRVRPFEGNVSLHGGYPATDEAGWGLWGVCFEPTDRFGSAHPEDKRWFRMRNGQLEETPWEN